LATISLAVISNITHVEHLREESFSTVVEPGFTAFEIGIKGTVVARGEVPRGVLVYLLTVLEYKRYEREERLPREFLGEGREELVAHSPAYLLVENRLGTEAEVRLRLSVHIEKKPYAWLAIPVYPMLVALLLLIFTNVLVKIKGRVET